MKRKQSISEYLASVAATYDIYSGELYSALLEATEKENSTCGDLSINCRLKTDEKITFLLKRKSQILAQFAVPTEFFDEKTNPLMDITETSKIYPQTKTNGQNQNSYTIQDIRGGMRRINLKAKVIEITKPQHVTTRYGNNATLAKALIEDETGSINLCLWNNQIDMVSVGDTITLENAGAARFNGKVQLNIGKKGKLTNETSPNITEIPQDELLA